MIFFRLSQLRSATYTSEVSHIFLPTFFYFHLYYFFQPIPIRNAILGRFYSCYFFGKRHSLGVTGVFL